MSKKTDTVENAEFEGTITVVTSSNPTEYGAGNVELEGTLYTDTILENTGNIGVNLEGINFNDSYLTIPDIISPINPSVLNERFYMEGEFLKSRNNIGIVTIYQPTTTKGDIITHDGSTQVRLPVSNDGFILTANSNVIEGIKWTKSIYQSVNFSIVGSGIDNSSNVIDHFYGSYFMTVFSFSKKGSSGIFLTSKNKPNIIGHIIKFNVTPSLNSSGLLSHNWPQYEEIQIYKNYNEADGDYYIGNNSKYDNTIVALSNTDWISLGTLYNVTTGSFFISIFSNDEGPCATFILNKSDEVLNCPAIFKISSSTGLSSNNINLRWLSLSGIEISKTNNNNNGNYIIIDNFQSSKIINSSFNLSNTLTTELPFSFFRFYQNKSFVARIYSNNILNSPKLIIFMSKNDYNNSGSKTLLHSPGKNTNEKINLEWGINSLLAVNKNGLNYNGIYNIDITILD